jgi:RHH-type proline utilization regulon transcriptional repressor/proline dehydrogenase/delta 1-pyrroline-5-carboxylate dehydrogenase
MDLQPLRDVVSRRHRADERAVLEPLVPRAAQSAAERARAVALAEALVHRLRERAQRGGGIQQFLQEYRLSTPEGVTLLCLAEAFLRIPDPETADALIRDKVGGADWEAHAGHSPSALVNLSTRALIVTQRLLEEAGEEEKGVLARLLAAGGEPLVRNAVAAAMRIMGWQFVIGRTIEEALARAHEEEAAFRHSFDMLGEGAHTAADARRYHDSYLGAIRHIGVAAPDRAAPLARRDSISVKLSALHPRYEVAQEARAVPGLSERLLELAAAARQAGIGLTVDAEESERLELSLDIFERVARAPELKGWEDGFGLAVQAYQKRALPVVAWVQALGAALRTRFLVRLVKGAYWDSEIKRTQERGLEGYPVFTRKTATDISYLACAREMLGSSAIYPAFATHNALSVATLLEWIGPRRDFEFQRLYGMGEGLYDGLIREQGIACRVYAPVGAHRDLLAYLVRRLLENGANTSFVHQVADSQAPLERLLADPVEAVRRAGCSPHPGIPRPADLYAPERRNSRGLDLSDREVLRRLEEGFRAAWAQKHEAAPWIDGGAVGGEARPVLDPADRRRIAGTVIEASAADAARAAGIAAAAADDWARRPVEERAACLERAADLLEADREALMALAVREAGKTIPDALAEVREAVDFCRYYAIRARRDFAPVELPGPTGESNRLRLAGRGAFACISPWNFPLAIFMGQVAAALAAGNAVLAKPAPQTPLIACRAVRWLLEAGVPPPVLHLLPGGPEVGQALAADPRIAGVAFTGSTATARSIAHTLAQKEGPIVPLIAETGGQNAMIVDSSALPEQVVTDVLASGFQSAGQRCSALRVLFLQEDIAEAVLEMLTGAMDELVVGDPARIETDVGPLIDEQARARLESHLASGVGRRLHGARLGAGCEHGCFFAPQLLELDGIGRLRGEVFGPIVHVVRWPAGRLREVVDAINATGYGLTLGVHSRIGRTVEEVRARARAGNLYVNRSMIGAVVGVQPFGGEGLSGTGPKAGGPHYLARFATERTVSIDTTSAGGNATLMSLQEP